MEDFLCQQELEPHPADPPGYSGLSHAVHHITGGYQQFEELDDKEAANIMQALCFRILESHVGVFFQAGSLVGDRWYILKELSVGGFFYRDVRIVYDKDDPQRKRRIMKIMPSEATWSGYSARELWIAYHLRGCANIIQ
ncbi:hypothetical protein EK21DRAFT_117516 [Setomelanomma holmii]|uniref:Uncharacterized protein n=1 Tax=Setomelanomma holmii TaxID=210430 RepID=A0A9P4GZX9_9PLEO|nr:hypothetical protein EK21DRAFT_117516 [Setomelanomma holmii]